MSLNLPDLLTAFTAFAYPDSLGCNGSARIIDTAVRHAVALAFKSYP